MNPERAVSDFASMIGAFYMELVRSGVPEDAAVHLTNFMTRMFFDAFIISAVRGSFGRKGDGGEPAAG